MQHVERLIQLKTIDDAGTFEGYASVFDFKDYHNDVVCCGAFQEAVDNFKAGKNFPKLLWQHDPKHIIGTWLEIREDDKGLFVKGKLFRESRLGREVYDLLKKGALDGLSIGFQTVKERLDEQTQTRFIEHVILHEISLVTFGANARARVLSVKQFNKQERKMNHQDITAISEKIENTVKTLDRVLAHQHRSNFKNQRFKKGVSFMEATDTSLEEFKAFVRTGISTKGLTSSTGSGAYLVPTTMVSEVRENAQTNSIRSHCAVEVIEGGSLELLVEKGLGGAGWVSEDGDRDETLLPELVKIKIPTHELYAKPRVSQKLMDDSGIDVESWVLNKIGDKMQSLENHAFLHGDGKGKPTGVLSYPFVDVGLGEQGFIEHVKSGDDGELNADALIEVLSAMRAEYLEGAVWVMSRSTLAAIRSLKDEATGLYLLQPNLAEGSGMYLLGYPVVINEEMPALVPGTASDAVIFGNFKRGYQIVDRLDMQVMRDPYSSKPFVEFYATKRVGGDVVEFDAFKVLTCSA